MKKIAILGSTGSIGTQTLDVVRRNKDIEVTLWQRRKYRYYWKSRSGISSGACAVYDQGAAELLVRLRPIPVKGRLQEWTAFWRWRLCRTAEILVTAIVGMIGIRPTLAAIQAGKDIALANKETLVTAGHLIMPLAEKKGCRSFRWTASTAPFTSACTGRSTTALRAC